MTLTLSKSKNSTSLYVTKSIYENGKRTSKVIENLGTIIELEKKLGGEDPLVWAKAYVAELTKREKEQTRDILVKYSPIKIIDKDREVFYNGGYLFLQKIYYELGLDKICQTIKSQYKFEFDLDSILSRLLYSRIIFPASKRATSELSKRFIQQPNYDIQHIYRGLEVIAKEMDFIQAELYKNSTGQAKRKTGVLYYDCTNYFFETEQEEGLKQYGYSKEHRPNPIVQMGLFIDGDGVPLAFTIDKGNTNEQTTLRPLEEKILSDFDVSTFVVCTDAGLSSAANRKFNDRGGRAFITTQSIKKLKKHLREWALDTKGWRLPNINNAYDISKLDEEEHKNSTFYKERWIKEDELEQKLIVTYSIKYRNYQRSIRAGQIERAEKELYSIDTAVIEQEEIFDGFYGVCTNLEDNPTTIIKINHRRWEIEECFRIMKSEFKARPVYLKRDDRIKAHFTTCFISLMIYRLLEKRLDERFTCHQIVDGLKGMNFYRIDGEGYIPTYTRTDFTDALHEAFAFRTDYQITTAGQMKKIFNASKN